MVQFELRKSKSDIGTLSVRIANRALKIDTNVSLHIRMKPKDWVDAMQLPKNTFDQRPVKELGGMSYATLTEKLQKIKRTLTALEDAGTLTKANAREVINEVLHEEVIEEAKKAEESVKQADKPTFTEFVRQYIADCEAGTRLKQKSTRKVMPGTLKNYKGFLAQMEEYQKSRHCVVDWDDFTLDFYNDYKQFFIEKNYSPNTIARHIKNMKTFLYAAKALHLTTRDDFTSAQWSADREDVDNIYIPTERLMQMADFDMSSYSEMKERAARYAKDANERDELTHALKRDLYRRKLSEARDIFVLGCLTGQRVSDYKRISRYMIETIVGERKFLHVVQVKTGKDVYVPYTSLIGKILDRYDGDLPKIYDQHLNERIKVVGLLLGWVEPAGLQERRGLLQYPSKKRFCDAIMTHTARRSFATNAYKNGIPLSAIMAVTGHSSEEMLKRYLKLNTKERAMLAAVEFDKIGKAM